MIPLQIISVPLSELGREFRFDNFEISWAGENKLGNGFFFGSEDGRFRTWNNQDSDTTASPSREAVNGIAFSNRTLRTIAVSTRSDVTFLVSDEAGDGHRAIFHGGAHDIIATSSGGFVAPLGRNRLLTMKPIPGPQQILGTLMVDNPSANFYKLAHCMRDGETDLIVGAARTGGFCIMEFDSLEDRINPRHIQFLNTPGLDIIDTCSLDSPEWPRAAAWLGLDGSIHLSRDVLEDDPPKSLRPGNLRGTAYSILHNRGHLFVLTSEAIYVLLHFASNSLAGDFRTGLAPVLTFSIKAVDIYAAFDNLLVQIDDYVIAIPTKVIESLADLTNGMGSRDWQPEFTVISWDRPSPANWTSGEQQTAA